MLTQLFVANCQPTTKAIDEWLCAPDESEFHKPTKLIKGSDPGDERYVLGIVLEHEVVDAQGDISSADKSREAAHRCMEEFGGLGLMHRLRQRRGEGPRELPRALRLHAGRHADTQGHLAARRSANA